MDVGKFESLIFKIENFTILYLKRMVGEWMMDPIKIPWFRHPGPSWSLVYLVRGVSRPNLTEGSLSAAMGCFVQGYHVDRGFDAIGEHTGAGHNRNIVMPFGGESPGSEGPEQNFGNLPASPPFREKLRETWSPATLEKTCTVEAAKRRSGLGPKLSSGYGRSWSRLQLEKRERSELGQRSDGVRLDKAGKIDARVRCRIGEVQALVCGDVGRKVGEKFLPSFSLSLSVDWRRVERLGDWSYARSVQQRAGVGLAEGLLKEYGGGDGPTAENLTILFILLVKIENLDGLRADVLLPRATQETKSEIFDLFANVNLVISLNKKDVNNKFDSDQAKAVDYRMESSSNSEVRNEAREAYEVAGSDCAESINDVYENEANDPPTIPLRCRKEIVFLIDSRTNHELSQCPVKGTVQLSGTPLAGPAKSNLPFEHCI
ncbi:hypothetical protein M5K25_020934 [Dendrobium thyrsiflorum]|uniref:Uncharacterized protein n=1 Tax=Dendrobium thyrsiflorum TaxID=117978 RepID=A0ABD0UBD1_DENTH